jgi:RNA polymerase sigma-70 factor (ECF subfamily)
LTDAELVAGLKANNDAAYREVLARFGDRLYRYVYGIVGDYHLTEDVVAETYLRMVERIDGYTFRGVPFQAWLYRIAHNQAINVVTRTRPAVDIANVAVAAPAAEPEAAVIARDESAAVRAAMTALTEDQQQVLMLRFVAEQSVRDVARSLEKTETAVKQLQLRALRSLGRLLGQEAG